MSETTLWTNSAPSSDFAAQDVTLSDNINNYKYIKITAILNNGGWSNVVSSHTIEVSEFVKSLSNTSGYINAITGRHLENSIIYYVRYAQYKGNTTVNFGSCIMVTGTSSAAARNQAMIPTQIVGLK